MTSSTDNPSLSRLKPIRIMSKPPTAGAVSNSFRPRRQASSRTPYDRPEPVRTAASSPTEKSDWLSTAGRVLVTGAGKLISSAIAIDSDTSSSGSDCGLSTAGRMLVTGAGKLIFDSDTSSSGSDDDDEVDNQDGQLETESQQVIFSSESKQKIEELIMQETFSREESDTLIKKIRSRELCENEEELLGSTELKPVKVEMKLDAEMPVSEETTDLPLDGSLKSKTDTDSEVQQFAIKEPLAIQGLNKENNVNSLISEECFKAPKTPFQEMSIRRLQKMLKEYSQKPCHLSILNS